MVSVAVEEANNILYASESISSLPSIQDALNAVSTSNKSEVHIVGGENEITEAITVPSKSLDGPGGYIQQLTLICRGDAYLTQASGADLERIIDCPNDARLDAWVNIHGNKANNTTSVNGVQIRNTGSANRVRGHITDCDVGVNVLNESEDNAIDVWLRNCGVGVQERSTNSGETPDQNRIFVRGHGNYGPYYSKSASANTSVRIDAEGLASGPAVELRGGATEIGGSIRGAPEQGVLVADDAYHVAVNGLNLNAVGGTATGIKVESLTNAHVSVSNASIRGKSNVDCIGIQAAYPVNVESTRIRHFDIGIELLSGAEQSFISPSVNISNVQTEVVNSEKANAGRGPWPDVNTTVSISSGGTVTEIGNVHTDRPHFVTAFPNNDPGNDHGYRAWSYTRSDGEGRVAVEEVMDSGGGEARVMTFYLDRL